MIRNRSSSGSNGTRSEQLRRRRSQRSNERVKKVTGRAYERRSARATPYSAVAPTIFVRGGFGTPVVRRAQSRVKRKVAIRLDSPGAELQMPALPVVQPGWRLLSALLVVALSALLYLVWTRPELQVSVPQVEGLQRLTPTDLDAVVELEGLPIFMVDPAEAEQTLRAAFPELKEVSVKVALPAAVKITAIERQPALAWNYNQQTLWVDDEGAIFPARGEPNEPIITVQANSLPPLLPVINLSAQMEGEAGAEVQKPPELSLSQRQVDPKLLDGIHVLNEQMPAGTLLAYNSRDGIGWDDPKGWRVFVGKSLDDLQLKMLVYRKIVSELEDMQVQPAMVSVAEVHAPYYRLEQ